MALRESTRGTRVNPPPAAAGLRRKPPPPFRTALIAAAYLGGFIFLDLLSQRFQELRGIVAWYPPAGLTYALLLTFGGRFTPTVTIALLLSSVFVYRMPQSPYLLLVWAVIISSIYGAAAWFLRHRIGFDWQLRRSRDVTWLVVTTLLVSAVLAILSVASSALSSDMPRSEVPRAILLWWIGETVGVLSVTPFLLVHVMPWLRRFAEGQPVRSAAPRPFPRPKLSVAGQVLSMALMVYWVFGGRTLIEFRPVYLIGLPLIWIVLDHGFQGAVTGIAALNLAAMSALWLWKFDAARIGELQLLMIVFCVVGLLLGALVTGRKRAEEELVSLAKYPAENPNPVLRLGGDGTVMHANAASGPLLSMWGSVVGGSAPESWHDLAAQALASRQNNAVDIECDGKDYSFAITPIAGQDYVNLYGRDVTERRRAEKRIQRQVEHLSALAGIDRVIMSNVDLGTSLTQILTRTTSELAIDAADILLLNPASPILECGAAHGFRTGAIRKARVHLGEGYAGRAALERRLVHVPDLREDPGDSSLTLNMAGEGFVCYYGVPLIAKGQVKGVLEVFHRTPLAPDAEWLDFLNSLAGQAAIAIDNSTLFDGLQRSNTELSIAYDATIEGWSHALDLRDKETEGHTERVTELTVKLARTFDLSEADLVQVRWGSLLHDIGKMGVPDGILLKPGPLTDEEWVAMKKHPTLAYEMLSPIHYLRLALEIPYCHHEKWDGSGYPRGLKGNQIPLVARIFAVVDVWDALNSDRPYRPAWTAEKARAHIISSSGTHFDPEVVKAFMGLMAVEAGHGVAPPAR